MKRRLAILLAALLLFTGCTAKPEDYETEFFAMDTVMTVHLYGAKQAQSLGQTLIQQINTLDAALSVTRPANDVSRLNAGESLTPSPVVIDLLNLTLALSDRTGGCLDPTVYPVVKLWGFTTGEYHVPSEAEIAETLQYCGVQHIHRENETLRLDQGSALDFGAVAKGYAAELCANQLTDAGVNGILALGGNIQTVGSKPDGSPWRVGVTDPTDPSRSVAVLNLTGSNAVVTSGGYQRYFEENGQRYSHIMDPATGKSAKSGLSSVTIVADSGFLADGLSTALYVMGPARAEDFWRSSDDFECVLITDDGKMLVTEGLADKIETDIGFTVIKR